MVAFLGLILLNAGGSQYYLGSTTKSLDRGTVLETNHDTQRTTQNAIDDGLMKAALGAAVLMVGAALLGSFALSEEKQTAVAVASSPAFAPGVAANFPESNRG